jgi:short-subunit dehydrogenase
MPQMRLDGKVALVTGASEGIGASVAHLLSQRGALLSLTARSKEKLRSVGGEAALITPGDITEADTRRAAVERTIERFGRIDILINNAGVGLYAPAHSAPIEEARRMWELNFFAPLDLTQRAVPYMKQQRSGLIVNVGSIAGKMTLPWFTLYSASKYALGSLTDGLRMELRAFGIHTMTVCPGYVNTGFQQNVLHGVPPPLAGRARLWAISADKCANDIVRGIERGKRTVVTPASGWLLIALERLFPTIVDRQLERVYSQQGMQR